MIFSKNNIPLIAGSVHLIAEWQFATVLDLVGLHYIQKIGNKYYRGKHCPRNISCSNNGHQEYL
jgi:hypothetical protein